MKHEVIIKNLQGLQGDLKKLQEKISQAIGDMEQFFCPSASGHKFTLNQQIVDGIRMWAECHRDMYTKSPKDFSTDISWWVSGVFSDNIPGAKRLPPHAYNGFSLDDTEIVVKASGWDNTINRPGTTWRASASMKVCDNTVLLLSVQMPPNEPPMIFLAEVTLSPSHWNESENYDGLTFTKTQLVELYNQGKVYLHVGDIIGGWKNGEIIHSDVLSTQQNIQLEDVLD